MRVLPEKTMFCGRILADIMGCMHDLFTRSTLNPILRPNDTEWWKVYNPAAVLDAQGRTHLFPRVIKHEDDWHSRIAHAVSDDGENFVWDTSPTLVRSGEHERRGLEDPRITRIEGMYYMTFAAFDGEKVSLHSAVTSDLGGPWERRGPMVPDFDFFKSGGAVVRWEKGRPVEHTTSKRGSRWSKSGALFPKRIDGRITLFFGEFYTWLATSIDGVRYEVDPEPFLQPRKNTGYFDNTFVEAGPPPILTEKGWLLFYHGIDEAFRYRLGFVLLEKDNPRNILYRTSEPVFGPEAVYEVGDALVDVIEGGIQAMQKMNEQELKAFYAKARSENVMPQVTFCPGAVLKDGNVWLYYGAGDTSVCAAWAPLGKILQLASV